MNYFDMFAITGAMLCPRCNASHDCVLRVRENGKLLCDACASKIYLGDQK